MFSPYYPHAGSSPVIYGLFAVLIVDLCQTWQMQRNPCGRLVSLIIQVLLLVMLGTLPWFNNLANIGGFIYGVVGSIVFLPFVTFGKFDKIRKRYVSPKQTDYFTMISPTAALS